MSNNETERTATAADERENANARAATDPSADTKPSKKSTVPKLPSLSGKYHYIKSLCESQRPQLGKVMADHSIAMFKTSREIHERTETLNRFDTTYVDKHDVDGDGKGKVKPFIVNSLRSKQPLNHSKTVQNDSRCNSTYVAIQAKEEMARSKHEAYKTEMSGIAKEIAELEIEARKKILCHQYQAAIVEIAEGLYFIGKKDHCPTGSALTVNETALAACKEAFKEFDGTHWLGLPFIASEDAEDKEKYFKDFQANLKYNHDTDIQTKIANGDEGFIEWIRDELVSNMPELTHEFWEDFETKESEKKMDSELALHFKKKEVDKANGALKTRMDTDEGDDAIRSIAREEIAKEKNKRVTNNKKKARKNSSGGDKNQEPKPTENGDSSNDNSRKKKKKGQKESSKRQSDDQDDRSRSRRRSNSNSRNSRDSNDKNKPSNRNRRSNSRSRQNDRRRSVSWGRSRTPNPPRSRYSRDRDYHSRGSNYHGSDTRYNPDWRGGGRSRNYQGGRGSRGGYNNERTRRY